MYKSCLCKCSFLFHNYLSVISSNEVKCKSDFFPSAVKSPTSSRNSKKSSSNMSLFCVQCSFWGHIQNFFFGWVWSMVAVCFLVGKVIFLVGGPQKGNNWCNHMHSKKSLYVSMSTVFSKEMTYFQTLIILLLYVTYIVGCEIE